MLKNEESIEVDDTNDADKMITRDDPLVITFSASAIRIIGDKTFEI